MELVQIKKQLAALKLKRRAIIRATEKATEELDDEIRDLQLKIGCIKDCQCFPECCHQCFIPIQNNWRVDESER